MRASELAQMTCTIARAVDSFGDAWTMMVIKELFLGQKRFDDIQTYTGISPHLLSVRMKKLEKHGIVQRRAYQERPRRYDYRLTEKGLDLWPILIAAKDWSAKWGAWPDGEPLKIRHNGCGEVTSLKVVCSGCGAPIGPRDVRTEMSSAMVNERALMSAHANERKMGAHLPEYIG
jgi:DNA-binding HxlR family transcriptional regulator